MLSALILQVSNSETFAKLYGGTHTKKRTYRGKEILEQLSKPRYFTEFKSRALFSAATQQGRKGRDFQTL